MVYYHASPIAGLKVLRPHVSNHHKPFVYLARKREHTVVYLSNGVEKYYRENHLEYSDNHYTWATYGFNQAHQLVLEEYYPDALRDTYEGVSGYIYQTADISDCVPLQEIPGTVVSEKPVPIQACEWIQDAYKEILKLEKQGLLIVSRYADHAPGKLEWIKSVIQQEYREKRSVTDDIRFLEAKFPFLTAEK